MRINTNVAALNAQLNLGKTEKAVTSSMEKLSSGFRINHASDDAAGLGIANKLRNDIRSLTQASRNAEQATAMLQVAEGATQTVATILDRMKELAAQAASSNSGDRVGLQAEFDTLRQEIGRIVSTTTYGGNKLVDGTLGTKYDAAAGGTTIDANANVQTSTITGGSAKAGTYSVDVVDGTHLSMTDASGNVQVVTVAATGAQSVVFDRFGISFSTGASFDTAAAGTSFGGGSDDIVIAAGASAAEFLVSSSGSYANNDLVKLSGSIDISTGATGLNIGTSDISTQAGGQAALTALDAAVTKVNTAISTIGATQSRIEFASQNVKTTLQNFSAAESTVRDLDMAEEMTKFSKNQILSQAGTAMLAQANQSGQGVLQLLRG